VYADADHDASADADVARIIAANLGRPVPPKRGDVTPSEAKPSSSLHPAAQNGRGATVAMRQAARG
jgi:hypothetical protein